MNNPLYWPDEEAILCKQMLLENEDFVEVVESDESFNQKRWFYPLILHFLSHLEFSEIEAQIHFQKIKQNREDLRDKMGRDLGLRLAAFDYFSNIHPKYKNPTILESHYLDSIDRENRMDSKTGCFNIAFIEMAVRRELARSHRYGNHFSIMMIDLDNFKGINDNHGHLVGDLVLKKFVSLLISEVRSEDLVGRFGGDEFVILMPHTEANGAKALGKRIHDRIIERFHECHKEFDKVNLNFSGGVASFPQNGTTYEELLENADRALYHSKLMGKNKVFSESDLYSSSELPRGEDQRQAPRYEVGESEYVHLYGEDSFLDIRGKVINISETGALIDCMAHLKPEIMGQLVQISGEKAKDSPVVSRVRGVVARTVNQIGQIQFNLGVCFLHPIEIPKRVLDLQKSR